MDENEAKNLASDWVRRLEATVLSKVHDNTTPTEGRHQQEHIVTNRFRHDRSYRSSQQPSPKQKINSDLTRISNANNHIDHEGDFATKSTLSNLDTKPRKTSNETLNHSSRNSPRTPRIDLEALRRKRLERFENNDAFEVRIDGGKDQNLGVDTQGRVPDSSLPRMLQCESRSDESPFHNDDKWNYTSYDFVMSTQRNDDDDKLRLELWGLRGAVESGQLDINSYLRPARSTELSQNIKEQSLVDLAGTALSDQSLSYQDNHSKTSSSRDNNYNLTSLSSEKEDFPTVNNSEDSLPLLASMLSIENPHGGGESRDIVDAKSTEAKEDFTRFSVSKHQPAAPFGYPVPQIEGNLYNGFETSDSESSVNTISLHSKNRIKTRAGLDLTNASKPLKSGRGKQKILHELTQFLDAERSNKKSSKEKEKQTDLHSEKQSPSKMPYSDEENQSYSAVDFLLKSSSPIPICENGVRRSRSISPEGHKYISTSAPITSNGDLNFPKQDSNDNEIYFKEEIPSGSLEKSVDHSGPVFGKACPTCNEVNSKAANWCIECGTALVAVKPTILDQEQLAEYQQQCQETRKLINEALEYRTEEKRNLSALSKKERKLKQDVINLSKEVEKNSGFSNESLQSNVSSYKRRWLKSSIAWSTYEPQELSKPSSIVKQGKNSESKDVRKSKEGFMDGSLRSRSSSDLAVIEKCKKKNKSKNGLKSSRRQRTTSATYHSADDYDSINLELTNQKSPRGSKSTNHTRPWSAKQSKEKRSCKNRPGSARPHSISPSPLLFEERNDSPLPTKKSPNGSVSVPQLNLDDVGSYDRILTLIRSQRDSEPVPYLYLPDEILLEIFCNLSNKDLVSCACVCTQFYRIAMDETLWKTIIIRKNRNICDAWLDSIGNRHPSSLTISQCSSNKVSSEGLRSLFRKCSESLEEVDFSGCSGGELIGESILLHISVRCFNVVSVDVSWTNVSDNGVRELAKNLKRLESLCLNGCQAITDKSLTAVSKRHGESLRIFEVFGCFNITPAGLLLFGSQCVHLQTLNIGQCHKMTDSAVGNLVSHLPEIENLDLRGCKQTRDSAVKKIVRHCPYLKSLVLANCPLITDSTLSEISTNLPGIKSLDICGCSYITDAGVRALARCCHKLELLDLSSTGTAVTSKSIVALSNYCSQSLRVLKLSFCSDISVNTVNQVVKNCKKLTLLHLYGCKRIKELDKIKNIGNPNLVIER